ncbi:MAG: hypothetical protein LBG43_03485 [Treponema sp.]|nr:hypothetical protein [Treponema sp.]
MSLYPKNRWRSISKPPRLQISGSCTVNAADAEPLAVSVEKGAAKPVSAKIAVQ